MVTPRKNLHSKESLQASEIAKMKPVPPGSYTAKVKQVTQNKSGQLNVQLDMSTVQSLKKDNREYTGSSVNYYRIPVVNPTTPGVEPYIAECNDIIEALELDYAEGNALKAIWRIAAARKGLSKRGYTGGKYDAEKTVFFGQRMLVKQEGLALE